MEATDNCGVKLEKLTSYIRWFLSVMAAPDGDETAKQQTEAFFSAIGPSGEMLVPNFEQFCIGCEAAMKIIPITP